jgi:hypothetical protein
MREPYRNSLTVDDVDGLRVASGSAQNQGEPVAGGWRGGCQVTTYGHDLTFGGCEETVDCKRTDRDRRFENVGAANALLVIGT